RMSLKRLADRFLAEDLRQGTYIVAMQLVLGGKGPKPGFERGWMCRVQRNHVHEFLRARKEEEKPLEKDEEPDIPVDDQRTLLEAQLEVEKRLQIAEDVLSQHPERVADVLEDDGRSRKRSAAGESAAKDAKTRKRRERSRTALASIVSAMVAAAVLFLVLRGSAPTPTKPGLPAGAYADLAGAAHDLARRTCAEKRWIACLEDLDQMKRLDPRTFGPEEAAARTAAVDGVRADAFAQCTEGHYVSCLEGLDTAAAYDPAGDADARVQLARSEAQVKLQGSASARPGWVPDAKGIPPKR
ncbi:MAG TPA: hypothetical protein VGL81_37315, partial [Polyangiaceae bacterium]